MEPRVGKMLSRLDELQVWPQVFPGITYWEVQPVLKDLQKSIARLKDWGFETLTDPWLPYMMAILHWSGREVAENICSKYSLSRRQTEKVMITLERWKDVLAAFSESSEDTRLSQLAEAVLNLPQEAYPMLLTVLDEKSLKQRLKTVLGAITKCRPSLNGEYIKNLGYKPGPIYREALSALWRSKMDGLVGTVEEEREFLNQFLKRG
jgi:tRNA nucleotidyltransferase (CCA-adding enzyme)